MGQHVKSRNLGALWVAALAACGGGSYAAPRSGTALAGASGYFGGGEAPVAVTSTTSTTSITTVTVASPAEQPAFAHEMQFAQSPMLTAGSVGDVDRFEPYLDFVARHPHEAHSLGLALTRRVRVRVLDSVGQQLAGAVIRACDSDQNCTSGVTHADGRWDFFPSVAGSVTVSATHMGGTVEVSTEAPSAGEGQGVTLQLTNARAVPSRALDLGFVIDVTGSMEDELRYINREIGSIVGAIRAQAREVDVRVGAILYRDRTDPVALQQIAFTDDVAGFATALQTIHASGGGDYPEDLNSGLEAALSRLAWRSREATCVLVLIGDAPPKRYADAQYTYQHAMIDASARGIRVVPVAASGADRTVEFLFRALGVFTSTPYVYLTDDSGIGGTHLEADTDRVAVEYFADLLTRLVLSDLQGRGMHEPGIFGPPS